MADTGIVIVTYFSEREIGPCLDAALASGADVVVVDNGSSDGSIAEAARRGVRLIANSENRGFAAAVNQGIAALDAPFILLLNPDAVLCGGLDQMRAACLIPHAAGAGGCLLGEDGAPQAGFMVRALPTPTAMILEALLLNRLWPNNPVNRRYRGLGLDYSARIAVEQPAGAFLMIRRSVWQELNGFDEGFHPLWFEDVDFCRRAVVIGDMSSTTNLGLSQSTPAHTPYRVSPWRSGAFTGIVVFSGTQPGISQTGRFEPCVWPCWPAPFCGDSPNPWPRGVWNPWRHTEKWRGSQAEASCTARRMKWVRPANNGSSGPLDSGSLGSCSWRKTTSSRSR